MHNRFKVTICDLDPNLLQGEGMTTHPRIPALVAMIFTATLGLLVLAATGQFRTTDLSHATLEQLEKKITTSQDGRVWLAYGDRLRETNKPDAAAKAYERAIAYQPDLTDA